MAGSFLLLCAVILAYYFDSRWSKLVEDTWHRIVPHNNVGIPFLSLILGLSIPTFLNVFLKRRKDFFVRKALIADANNLEILFDKSVRETKQIAITLRSYKVYVGAVTEFSGPKDKDQYVEILPTLSGYRVPENKKVIFTTRYFKIKEILDLIEKESQPDDPDFTEEDFTIVLPISEIMSANIFNLTAYEYFQMKSD